LNPGARRPGTGRGGGIVPAPPRSGVLHESCVGLSASLEASGADNRAIAAKEYRRTDVVGCSSSKGAAADVELNWMKELGCIVLSRFGATQLIEKKTQTLQEELWRRRRRS